MLFIICCLQNLTIISMNSFGVKLYHVAAMVSIIYLVKRGTIVLPNPKVLFFGVIIVVISVINSLKFGLNSFLLNYLFAFYFLILIYNIGRNLDEETWISIFSRCATLLMIVIWVKNTVYIKTFIAFFQAPYGHPDAVLTFFGGGVNLEASYMAMLTPLFFRKEFRTSIVYSISSTLLSLIYVSRTALIINMICWMWIGLMELKSKHAIRILELVIVFVIALFALIERGSASYMIERIMGLGNLVTEPGAQGRLRMWRYVWEAILNNPLGAGIGNSIKAIEDVSGLTYGEDNIHNIYMQMFIDLGFLGGLYYLSMILKFLKTKWKKIYLNPISSVLMLYVCSSFLQFRGAEIFVYFFLASYLVIEANRKKLIETRRNQN